MPFYLLHIDRTGGSGAGLVVTTKGFPELRLSVRDSDEVQTAACEAIKQALAQRRARGEPIPEPLAERPTGDAVVEVLDDWVEHERPLPEPPLREGEGNVAADED